MAVLNSIAHSVWDVVKDDTGKLVAKSTEKNIAHNMENATNWQDTVSNNGIFMSARDRFLAEASSPATYKNRKGETLNTRTQQDIGNFHTGYRGNIRQGKENLRGNMKELQGYAEIAEASGDTAAKRAYDDAIGNARKDLNKLSNKELTSYGKQAWDHTKRVAQWTQEGSTPDRLKKTTAVVGGYAGANIGLRALTGGGATYNNDGQRDIAGIPFL